MVEEATFTDELLTARQQRDERVKAAYGRWALRNALPNQYLAWLTTRRFLMTTTALSSGMAVAAW